MRRRISSSPRSSLKRVHSWHVLAENRSPSGSISIQQSNETAFFHSMEPSDAAPPASSLRTRQSVKKSSKRSSKARGKKPSLPGRRGRSRSPGGPEGIGAEMPRSVVSVRRPPDVNSEVATPSASAHDTVPSPAAPTASALTPSSYDCPKERPQGYGGFSASSPTGDKGAAPDAARGFAFAVADPASINTSEQRIEATRDDSVSSARASELLVDVTMPFPEFARATPYVSPEVLHAEKTIPATLHEDIPAHARPLYLDQGPSTLRGRFWGPSRRRGSLALRSLDGQVTHRPGDRGHQVPQQWPSRRWFALAAVAVGVFAVAVMYWLIKAALVHPPNPSNACKTFACREYARRLRATVNVSANPCQSFTRFVCDGWRRKNLISVWEDQFVQVITKLGTALHDAQWPRKGQNEEQRAAAMYQSCEDVLQGKRDELPAVKAALSEAGIVWPQLSHGADAIHTLVYCSLKLGWDVLLDFSVQISEKGNVTLVVGPGKSISTVLHLYYRPDRTPASKVWYFEFLRRSFQQTGNTGNNDVVTYNATSNYEERAMPSLASADYGATGVRSLADILTNATRIDIAEVRWFETLQKLNVSQSGNLPSLLTKHGDYLETLVNVWMDLGDDSFHEFVSWCTVQIAALYSNQDLVLNYYGFEQQAVHVYHTAFCVTRAAYFSRHATFARYNREVLKGGAEDAARKLALAVRSAFSRRLSSWNSFDGSVTTIGNWSSLATVFRSFGYGKPNETDNNQPFPDMTHSFVSNWKHSVLVERTEEVQYLLFAIDQLSFYIIIESEQDFQLMPYSLSYPLFDFELPAAVNYAGFGALVGEAVSSMFLTSYAIWNAPLVEPFMECIVRGPFGGVSDLAAYAAGPLMLGAVVDAYKSGGHHIDQPLEGFEQYTGLQTLFISRCYTRCRGSLDEEGDAVCDLSMQYVPEFAEAFDCHQGDLMFPSHQCRLF